MENITNTLLQLEEERQKDKTKLDQHQKLVKRWFDNKSSFERDLVLKWDKSHEGKGEHAKFQILWLGSFIITEKIKPNNF